MRLRIGTNGACNIKVAAVYRFEYWTRLSNDGPPVFGNRTGPPHRASPRFARALHTMICNSIMTSRDRNSCYNRPFSTTARNKIHETVVTFMRGIGKKYSVNTFAIHERCRFYERVSRTHLAPPRYAQFFRCVLFLFYLTAKTFLDVIPVLR